MFFIIFHAAYTFAGKGVRVIRKIDVKVEKNIVSILRCALCAGMTDISYGIRMVTIFLIISLCIVFYVMSPFLLLPRQLVRVSTHP